MLREALKRMGREDLIGSGKKHLVPAWQPVIAAARKPGQESRGKRPGRASPSADRKPARSHK
jgi:hypothetical protein